MERDSDPGQSRSGDTPNPPGLRRRRFAALAASLSLPLAGCRTDDSDDDSPNTPTSIASSGGTEPGGGAASTDAATDAEGSTETVASPPAEAGRYGDPDDPVADPVGLETVAAELNYPVDVAFPPGADLIYRGSALPELEGKYLFGDLEHQGRLFVGTPPGETGDGWSLGHVNLTGEAADDLGAIFAFGRDGEGEMYVVAGNALYRIVPG